MNEVKVQGTYGIAKGQNEQEFNWEYFHDVDYLDFWTLDKFICEEYELTIPKKSSNQYFTLGVDEDRIVRKITIQMFSSAIVNGYMSFKDILAEIDKIFNQKKHCSVWRLLGIKIFPTIDLNEQVDGFIEIEPDEEIEVDESATSSVEEEVLLNEVEIATESAVQEEIINE